MARHPRPSRHSAARPRPAGRPAPPPARWRHWPLVIVGGGTLLLLFGIWLAGAVLGRAAPTPATGQAGPVALLPTEVATPDPSGFDGVIGCRGFPQFTMEHGFTGGVIVNTSMADHKGLVLQDPSQPRKGFQLPGWDQAGYLGPFATDGDGNIYVGPVPLTSLVDNPPEKANTIWRVDTRSGAMAPFLDLPAGAPPSERNPFGILGLAYDCDTNTLYASSVAGSGPRSEVGRLYQIDLAKRQVISQVEGIDALSVVIARTPEGKRLYYGAARQGIIASLALDERGGFVGTPRQELDLVTVGAAPSEKARRISFSGPTMRITLVPFTFSLATRSQSLQRAITVRFDPGTRAWALQPTDASEGAAPSTP